MHMRKQIRAGVVKPWNCESGWMLEGSPYFSNSKPMMTPLSSA